MELDIDKRFELDSLRGRPDGPVKYIPELGMEVPTYIDPRKDLWPKGSEDVLMYHVPLKMRGPYKVRAGEERGPIGERINDANYCLCMATTRQDYIRKGREQVIAGRPCRSKAINLSGWCSQHGGALHPLDKSEPQETSREYRFVNGLLDPKDMDDEELARGQLRKKDGTWTNFRSVPAAVFQSAQRELFERADTRLRENLLQAVDTMAEIASGSAYEPEVRIRAAQFIYERVRGKNPDVVIHTQDKPFEVMMTDMVIGGGSRAASRAMRALENAVDAEVIEGYDDLAVVYDDSHNLDPAMDHMETGEEVELVPLTPDVPEHHGPAGKPMTTPPVDPLLRDKWEKDRIANETDVDETVQSLKARLDAARRKRYAARGKGLDHVDSYPYKWTNAEGDEWQKDPDDPQYEVPVNVITFHEPELAKVPAHVKAADTRRIRKGR